MMRCNKAPPEILRENRIVLRIETCARESAHKGAHLSKTRMWKDGDRHSLLRAAK